MVKGPATVVVDGECRVLGSDVSGRMVKVRPGKALPFEPLKGCRLRVKLSRGGRMWMATPEEAGVSMWYDVARHVSALQSSNYNSDKKVAMVVMLAGDSDTGKSTLATYLANVALGNGLTPCIIDGDIGQGDLAPPTGIGAAVISETLTDLRDASATLYEFIGNTSPIGFEHLVAKKLRSILERTMLLGDVCIVNTDGYARGGGVQYKLMLANAIRPNMIVCLENSILLNTLKGGPWKVVSARASSQVAKTRLERRSRRLDQFLRHVGSGLTSADLSLVKFVYMDSIFSPSALDNPPIVQLKPENMARMFVGLGSNGLVTGFGIIAGIGSGKIDIQTDVAHFDRIYLSNIRLRRDMPLEIRIA
jgi:polynucleotide 5'-hydroxyl-kinase GRC3/NOL9